MIEGEEIERQEMALLLEHAERFANNAHLHQRDQAGNAYIGHPRRVAGSCITDEQKIVAWLHDVIEDSEYTADDLRKIFPDYLVDAVVLLTRIEGQSYMDYLAALYDNELAHFVKIWDVMDNAMPSRLEQLPRGKRKRLQNKYERALKFLLNDSLYMEKG